MRVFVADNPDEVRKFRAYRGEAELLLRVSFRAPGAVSDLSRKFGCDPEAALELARLAAKLGVTVRGFSFHVGSQAPVPLKHVEAIEACGCADPCGPQAEARPLRPARHRRRLSHRLHAARAGHRPLLRAHPQGAACAAGEAARDRRAGSLYRWTFRDRRGQCHGRAEREGHWWYYLDDGLYGSWSGQLFDHASYPIESLKTGGELLPSVLAGPTCDSIDVIAENLLLPRLKPGDLIVGRAMGAYTWASASEFNFFPRASVVSVNETPGDTGKVED